MSRHSVSGARLLLSIASLAALSLLAESVLRTSNLDARLLKPLLYWVEDDSLYANGRAVYRTSRNAEKLYELAPGAEAVCVNCAHPLESKYKTTQIRINRLGFRDKERSTAKPPGVYRIVILGGSNTYGGSVSDGDTYPRLLDDLLNREAPGRFEVWNAGLNAYVMSQKVAYAEEIVDRYAPDLLIFSHENLGRRAFMWNDPVYPELFRSNPELYIENLPPALRWAPFRRVHEWLVLRAHAYRLLLALYYRIGPETSGFNERTAEYGDFVSERSLRRFVQSHPTVRLVLFSPLPNPSTEQWAREIGAASLSLWPFLQDKPAEYREIHPPAYVYPLYARFLLYELSRLGFLSLPKPPERP